MEVVGSALCRASPGGLGVGGGRLGRGHVHPGQQDPGGGLRGWWQVIDRSKLSGLIHSQYLRLPKVAQRLTLLLKLCTMVGTRSPGGWAHLTSLGSDREHISLTFHFRSYLAPQFLVLIDHMSVLLLSPLLLLCAVQA